MSTPQTQMYPDVDSLCTTGKPPVILTGIFRHLLIRHFSTADNISSENLKEFIWDSDRKVSKIVIDANTGPLDWQQIMYRPAIIIKRDALQAQKLAIDDYVEPEMSNMEMTREHGFLQPKPRTASGGHKFIRGKMGSHTIFCVARTGDLAEILAAEVDEELTQFAPLIRRDLKFNRFEEAQVGEVMQLEEENTHFVVPVVMAYAYTMQWKITPESLWFKAFNVGVQGE